MSKDKFTRNKGEHVVVDYPKARIRTASVKLLTKYTDGMLEAYHQDDGAPLSSDLSYPLYVNFIPSRQIPESAMTIHLMTEGTNSLVQIIAHPRRFERSGKLFASEPETAQNVAANTVALAYNQLEILKGNRGLTTLEVKNIVDAVIETTQEIFQRVGDERGLKLRVIGINDMTDIA